MPKHRLVALGDSLTQGFMSAAIHHTERSYPALIARAMGLGPDEFQVPTFADFGGLPVNLEYYLRRLEQHYGANLGFLEVPGAGLRLRSWMDEAEDHWERGGGTAPRAGAGPFHNLASWGMTVDDTLHLSAGHCAQRCAEPTRDNLLNQVPENAFYRTLLTVLNPAQTQSHDGHTALDRVKDLANDGGVENLIVALGANNALGTVTHLEVRPTDDGVLNDPIRFREHFNLWQPTHFAKFYGDLANAIETLRPERVFLTTVPHVTIAPLARGVGTTPADRLPDDPRYFRYYTYFWITDEDFDPDKQKKLTGQDAKWIDNIIDQYNVTIQLTATERRRRGLHWHVVDLCNVLDRLAYRRYREIGEAPPGGPYPFPDGWEQALRNAGISELTTHYLQAKDGVLSRGGLFSLDGVHPTTMGYGLVAHEFLKVMKDAQVPMTGPGEIDFAALLQMDSLVRQPPGLLDDAIGILKWLDGWIGLSGVLQTASGGQA